MINRFLTAKHWQLFLLMFAIPMVLEIGFTIAVIINMIAQQDSEFLSLPSFTIFLPFIVFFLIGGMLGWFWSIGVGLQKLIPEEHRMKVTSFKFFVLFPLIYFIFFTSQMSFFMSEVVINPLIFLAIFPMHLFAMFCMVYNFYFVARTLKTIELQRKVEFSEYIGEFFLLWFYPVGVWIIQPKINKMVTDLLKTENKSM